MTSTKPQKASPPAKKNTSAATPKRAPRRDLPVKVPSPEVAETVPVRANPASNPDAGTAMAAEPSAPRAGTKRAQLIALLVRPEGASVTEIGRTLGWLPHTVRAALTGLRHAGQAVTRAKADDGGSIYRVETGGQA